MRKLNERRISRSRHSSETEISLTLNLDGEGRTDISTGFGLLDHMLTLTMFWASMDIMLKCKGDLHIDAHHTVEDTGLVLGGALVEALADKVGIARVGHGRVPMDDALVDVAVDFSGRPWLEWRGDDLLPPLLGGEERDLWREFYKALATSGRFNLHVNFLYGRNGHHLLESAAKGTGIALAQAVHRNCLGIRSTKGGLD